MTNKSPPFKILLFGCSFTYSILNAQSLPNNINLLAPRGDDKGFVNVVLEKYDIRDSDHFKFYIDDQDYSTSENASDKSANPSNFTEININETEYPVRTYRGYVEDEPNSIVAATIWPGNKKISLFVQEGIRYLWEVKDLPININLNTGQASISVTNNQAYNYSNINEKSPDWVPTFGNQPHPIPDAVPNVSEGPSPYGWSMIPNSGFLKMQVAYDLQPEWYNNLDISNNQEALAIIEHGTNLLDLQFARDLGIQFRLTGLVRRVDTDALKDKGDAKTIWMNKGLGDNPGSSNTKANSIPFQHLVYTQIGEGNPVAYRSKLPLSGGNYTMLEVKKDYNGGLQHEISHTWGGAHYVYPNDIMSGGGSWFGPTTNQKHIFNRNSSSIGDQLPVASNEEYGFNLHPYATPDLVKSTIGQTIEIEVLKNDFDCNGDPLRISTFDSTTINNATISSKDGKLSYTPNQGFIGRDQFEYVITDGKLFNTTWVQVDVSTGELELRYDFEKLGDTLYDISGSNLHGQSENFTPTFQMGVNNSKAWYFPDLSGNSIVEDYTRAFVSFGDITDPFNKSHSVSIWFKVNQKVLDGNLHTHIVANSSTVIDQLVSGYNIYINKTSKKITFEVKEQLVATDLTDKGKLIKIIGDEIQHDTWYHVVMVIDREKNELRSYLNGTQTGTTEKLNDGGIIKGKPEGDRYTSGALGVSTYKPKKYTPFVGVMDEFRVYGRPLNIDEINSLYENPTDYLDIDTPTKNSHFLEKNNFTILPLDEIISSVEIGSKINIYSTDGILIHQSIKNGNNLIPMDFTSIRQGKYFVIVEKNNIKNLFQIIRN